MQQIQSEIQILRGYKAALEELREESILKYSNRIKFRTPEMIKDYRNIQRDRETPAFLGIFGGGVREKTIFDTYLKSMPASNREANLDRQVTSVRFVVESDNKSIKRFRFLKNTIQDGLIFNSCFDLKLNC